MDLSAFYGGYRADGHGRAAYEPSMMVAVLLYAYARGVRSSRAIERACEEDVERVDDEPRAHVVGHRADDHPPRQAVDDEREVEARATADRPPAGLDIPGCFQRDEWLVGRRYLSAGSIAQSKKGVRELQAA